MSSIDLVHLFATVYDELWNSDFQPTRPFGAATLATAASIEKLATKDPSEVVTMRSVASWAATPEEALGLLVGLDALFEQVHPLNGSFRAPSHLQEIASHGFVHGRLDDPERNGAVLWRYALPARPEDQFPRLDEVFASVVRCPPEHWRRVSHVVVDPHLSLEVGGGTLKVVCMPFIADPKSMFFTSPAAGYYQILPRLDARDWGSHIEAALFRLDRSEATIALLPELTCSPELLVKWQAAIKATPGKGPLRWIVCGTGPFRGPQASLPPLNRATVLDRVSGTQVFCQDKQYPFTLSGNQLRDWGLESRLGTRSLKEFMSKGTRMIAAEVSGARIAILICEDLARIGELVELLRCVGISVLLVPILSKPTLRYRWEEASAKDHLGFSGAASVISNSLVVYKLASGGRSGAPGVSMAVGANNFTRLEWNTSISVARAGTELSTSIFEINLFAP